MSVFANGREVSGKAQANQIIAGFPSVCLSPPSPPAGPVPIPYPMFTNAKKTSQGTTTVKIKKKEVGKKNSSTYKKSNGNEAATRSFGMDVVTHTLSGATKHKAYSFDVKAQGAGVNRFSDMTTTNHNNPATAATIDAAGVSIAVEVDHDNPCEGLAEAKKKVRDQIEDTGSKAGRAAAEGSSTVSTFLHIDESNSAAVGWSGSSNAMLTRSQGCAKGRKGAERRKMVNKDTGGTTSEICGGYEHPQPVYRNHPESHTEARILETLLKEQKENTGSSAGGPKGKLVISIDWPSAESSGMKPHDPCSDCEALLRHAANCMDIEICEEGVDEDGEKVFSKRKIKKAPKP